MSADQYRELMQRLESADGPDRKLDVAIGTHVSGLSVAHFQEAIDQIGVKGSGWTPDEEEWPRYTDSVDAALTLVPMSLYWLVGCGKLRPTEPLYGAQVLAHDRSVIAEAESDATPAIALCIAALRIRADQIGTESAGAKS